MTRVTRSPSLGACCASGKAQRCARPAGQIEQLRTQEILRSRLPAASVDVLDIAAERRGTVWLSVNAPVRG